jgi:serine/threonine-protein kinase RsbW
MIRKNESRLVVPSDTKYLQLIGDYISNIAKIAGFSIEEIKKIELAVDEACTNAIEHAYNSNSSRHFTIRTYFTAKELGIVVQDKGKPFNSKLLEKPLVVDKSKEGGMGLILMRKTMDEVKFVIKKGGVKEFHLTKYKSKKNV